MIMTRLIQFTLVALIAGLALGLCACDELTHLLIVGGEEDGLPTLEMDIGLTVPLTGEHAAPYGFSMQRGFARRLDGHRSGSGSSELSVGMKLATF